MNILILFLLSQVILPSEFNLKIPNQERIAKIDNKIYLVKYTNISEGFSVPATYPAGQPHHGCKCLVYFVEDNLLLGTTEATWTPNGCFEDNPQMIAEKVLEELRNNL